MYYNLCYKLQYSNALRRGCDSAFCGEKVGDSRSLRDSKVVEEFLGKMDEYSPLENNAFVNTNV